MRTLYAAVDTTGRFLFREPITHPDQPHLARLAWIIADDAQTESQWCRLIRPQDQWIYEPDAVVAHGILPEKALAIGVNLPYAVTHFMGALDGVERFCSFNVDFGAKVLQRAAFECGHRWRDLFQGKTMACAMRRATDLVQKPRMAPGGGFSWPKLAEAYAFFADDELPPVDMDPIERGLALARVAYIIDQGILATQRSNPHE